jgi:hypothetical protein
MVNYCLVVPLLPGKMEFARKFVEENGGHNKEHDEFYQWTSLAIHLHSWSEVPGSNV